MSEQDGWAPMPEREVADWNEFVEDLADLLLGRISTRSVGYAANVAIRLRELAAWIEAQECVKGAADCACPACKP